ncbi:ParA family protein [Algicella marina]|uniref:AAA family ATPase n=1 Tax=Algicella marina TaxID=2683284 RepID=A0A6P1SVJ6_9RHOB|nr:ParA family protein [Algicella marina]QHQ33680.1 AAA family ATPase [Algicella marina]
MGLIVSFAQQKGGAGKTTLLIHLAEAWRQQGRKVGVIDLDPQRTLSSWWGLAEREGMACAESAGWRAGSDIKQMARDCDITLVDCPGNASNLLESALRESDLVLVPCQPTGPDVWATGALLKMAKSEKTPARVVLNRVPPRGGTVAESLATLKAEGAELLKGRVGNRIAFSSHLMGGGTALTGRKTRASEEIDSLRKELDRLLKKLTA